MSVANQGEGKAGIGAIVEGVFSVTQLSRETGLSSVTLLREIKRGHLQAFRKGGTIAGGGKYYITDDDAKNWARSYFRGAPIANSLAE